MRLATVNLATETAVVWALPEARSSDNWKKQLGEKLADQLTVAGFKSNLRGMFFIKHFIKHPYFSRFTSHNILVTSTWICGLDSNLYQSNLTCFLNFCGFVQVY